MQKTTPIFINFLLLTFICFFIIACQTTTRNISPDEEMHYDEAYDFSDKKKIVDTLVAPLIAPQGIIPNNTPKPVIIIYGIANHTSEHIDTSGITDDIRMKLLRSGRFQFINETQRKNIAKETSYQYGGSVDPGSRIALGRQAGAQYMLTGTLRSIEKEEGRGIRLTKKSLRYYSLNLELTDLKTSLITWADNVELAREASKPIIGW